MEQFQGQEKSVIIVSSVRAQLKHVAEDRRFNLGFIFNEKRFNVALTRAKCLLIVVGDPDILATDNNWRKFLDFCLDKNCCIGAPIPKVFLKSTYL